MIGTRTCSQSAPSVQLRLRNLDAVTRCGGAAARKGPEPVRTVNEHATEHAQANDRRRLCDADRMTPGDPRLRNGTGTDVKRPTFQRPASISPCICIRAGRSDSPIYRSSGEQCAGLNDRRCGGVDCIVGEHHWTGDVNSRVATRSGCSCHTLTQLGIPSAISSRLLSERQKLFIAYSTFSAHPRVAVNPASCLVTGLRTSRRARAITPKDTPPRLHIHRCRTRRLTYTDAARSRVCPRFEKSRSLPYVRPRGS